jgi:hypothetical protein
MEKVANRVKAHIKYTLADGTLVPGVTTVLGILNKPALIPWANKLGLQGIEVGKFVDDKAAIGTLAHQMIADYLRGIETDTSEYSKMQIDQAENSVLSFFEWEKAHKLHPILIEEPMVSERHGFGGTLDLITTINGEPELCLIDFKTSGGIFPEMFVQVAAYRGLAFEHELDIKKVRILRIGRTDDEGFEDKPVNHLDKRWEIFLHCLAIYQLQAEVKK